MGAACGPGAQPAQSAPGGAAHGGGHRRRGAVRGLQVRGAAAGGGHRPVIRRPAVAGSPGAVVRRPSRDLLPGRRAPGRGAGPGQSDQGRVVSAPVSAAVRRPAGAVPRSGGAVDGSARHPGRVRVRRPPLAGRILEGGVSGRHAGRTGRRGVRDLVWRARRPAGVARRRVLRAADLLQPVRLRRHGDRVRTDVRVSACRELPLAVRRRLRHRVLAPLVRHAVRLVPRVCGAVARPVPRPASRARGAHPADPGPVRLRRRLARPRLERPRLGLAPRGGGGDRAGRTRRAARPLAGPPCGTSTWR